jgi:aerobic C4-dicarboxylate transport protein
MYQNLYAQVIVAILAGVAFGYGFPDQAVLMKPLGDGFIKLIKMLIGPLVFCTIVTGIAGMRNMRNAGRVGLKAIIYFEISTVFALAIGLFVVNTYKPGSAIHVDVASLDAKLVAPYVSQAQAASGTVEFLLDMIPNTITDAFAKGNMLQILVVAVLFAIALTLCGNRAQMVSTFFTQLSEVLFTLIGIVVKLAPIGAFGAMAFTIGKYGVEALTSLAHLMLSFYVTCALFIALVLAPVMRLCGLRIWAFLKYIKEELVIVLGTSSSETALPRLIEKLVKMGCSRPVVGMVVPAGYSFNLDGTCIYLTMAAIFIAQAVGMELTLTQELTLLAVLLLTSKGAAGVTGSGFVVLAGSLSAVGHIPVEGLALILGIDRFMSEGRAITNFIGNGVATVFIAKWEKAIDMDQAKATLKLN